MSYIDTRRFNYQPEPLQPLIRTLNGHRLPFAYADSAFVLTGEQKTARIGFEVLGDNRPAQTQYAWQFDDGAWSGWQTEPYIVLRDYNGGAHTFRLKARTGGLNETREQLTAMRFRASIPWYDNPGFRKNLPWLVVGLLLLGALLVLNSANNHRQVRRTKRQLQEREKESLYLNVQTIQSQLNTHFMFNVLVPLQNLILKNKPDEAARLLVQFSQMVRGFLNASAISNDTGRAVSLADREISLAEEIALLKQYVNFEQLLYRDNITVHFDSDSLDDKINPETVTLPPMLIQPFVENAIKHGLVHKEGPGNLWIRFVDRNETLICTIEDDGIGRERMQQIHQTSRRAYKSLGADLVQQRVDMLNQLGYKIRIQTDDRQAGGTVVTLTIARTNV